MAPEIIVDKPEAASRARPRAARRRRPPGGPSGSAGRFALALPGGSVAESFLPALADADVDWAARRLLLGRRAGGAPGPRRLELRPRPTRLAQARGLPGACPSHARRGGRPHGSGRRLRARAAEAHSASPPASTSCCSGWVRTATSARSFPGTPALREATRWVLPIEDSPKPPPARLTLTLAALALADLVIVGAFGGSKAEPVRQALRDPASALPVALAARGARRALFLLDEDAARGLA